MPKTAYYQYLN